MTIITEIFGSHEKLQDFSNSFHGRTIPLPVSVQLTYPNTEEKDFYKNYNLEHVAIVDKAAYGPVAKAIGVCRGDYEGKCREELQKIEVPIPMANNTASVSFASPSASASASDEKTAAARASDPLLMRNTPGWEIFYKPPIIPVQGKKQKRLA